MNYREVSDFGINKAVAMAIGINAENFHRDSVNLTGCTDGLACHYDYCNNPSDAWPIIESIWDNLMKTPAGYHGNTVWNQYCFIYKISKLRAAMIIFLEMKDAQQ